MIYYLARIRKPIGFLKKDGVYWLNHENAIKINPIADIYDFSIIQKYTNQQTLLIIRSGGIGDLIAASILGGIAPQTIFLTQKKHAHIFDWWQHKPVVKSFNDPIFYAKNDKELRAKASQIGTLIGDDLIEQGSGKNWMEIFSEAVGRDLISGVPLLKKYTGSRVNGCLIVHTASSINRTADRDMLVRIAKVHYDNVVVASEMGWTTPLFIKMVCAYEMVISVDTSALHFREGVGMPAFGIYGAFTTESRTKHYKITKSIDVQSDCPFQPCFTHSDKPCKQNKGLPFAPCLTNFIQIEKEFGEYLKTI